MKQSGNDARLTIKDVAHHAGVSRATASRALSDYGTVNADTRDRVRQSADLLGYVPNVLARSMRAGTTQTLGLIITEVGLSVFDLAMRAVIDAAHTKGYQVLVANTNEDLTAERESVRVMLEKQVDGLILVPSSVRDLEFLSRSAVQGKPIVLLDRTLASLDIPSVAADNRRGAIDAVAHIVERGHTRIGLIVVTSNIRGTTNTRPAGLVSTLDDRVEGYYAGMADADLSPESHWIGFTADSNENGASAVRAMLDSPNPPTALLASNANMSLAILRVAKERSLTIGVDLSVIGFDDAPWAAVMTPSLTVVDLPIEAMAIAAVDNLIALIANEDAATLSLTLPMQLIIRESVARKELA